MEEKKKKQVILDKYNMLAVEACSKDSLRPALQKMAITPETHYMAAWDFCREQEDGSPQIGADQSAVACGGTNAGSARPSS